MVVDGLQIREGRKGLRLKELASEVVERGRRVGGRNRVGAKQVVVAKTRGCGRDLIVRGASGAKWGTPLTRLKLPFLAGRRSSPCLVLIGVQPAVDRGILVIGNRRIVLVLRGGRRVPAPPM